MLRTFICSILQCSRFTLNNFRHIRFNSLDTLSVQVPALPQVQLYRPRTLDWIRIQKNPWRRQPRAFTWLCSCMNSKQSRLSLSWLTNNIPMYMTIWMHTWAFLSWIGSWPRPSGNFRFISQINFSSTISPPLVSALLKERMKAFVPTTKKQNLHIWASSGGEGVSTSWGEVLKAWNALTWRASQSSEGFSRK